MKGLLCALLVGGAVGAAEIPAAPLVKKGKQLISEDFEKEKLGPEWKSVIPTFTVAAGVYRGAQTRDDHGAVGAVLTPQPFSDAVIEFKFRLEGSPNFNAVCDDRDWKGSHAGHICRVVVTPKQLRLGDDKEGVMRQDIYEMSRDPARKKEVAPLIEGRGANFPINIAPHEWHRLTIEIAGDQMRVLLDDQPKGYLKSPGLAHPTKNQFHFTVTGKSAEFDEVMIFAGEQ